MSRWDEDPIPTFEPNDDGVTDLDERLDRFASAAALAGVNADKAAARGVFIDGVLPNMSDELAQAAMPLRWRIADDGAAEWAGRVRAAARLRIEESTGRAERWVAQINDWLEGVTRRDRLRVAAMEALLEDYALRQRDETGGARKTIKLPSVEVGTTRSAPRPEVVKADEFLAWAEDYCPDLIRMPAPEPAVFAFKDWLEVGETVYAYQYEAELSCGHLVGWADPPDDDDNAPDAPTEMICGECPADPIDGAPEVVVVACTVTPLRRPAVFKKGTEIEAAGLALRPEVVTAKVKP